MPESNGTGGLSSADFRARAAVQSVAKAATTPTQNPIDEVYSDARKLSAINAARALASSQSTEAIKAETDQIMAEVEKEKAELAKAELKSGASGPGGLQDFLMARIDAAEAAAAQARDRTEEAERRLFEDRIGMLSSELSNLRAQFAQPAPAPEAPGSRLKAMAEELEAYDAIKERLAPAPPPPQGVLPYDPATEKFRIMTETELKKIEFEREQLRYEYDRKFALEREVALREQARLDEAQKVNTRFMSETVPELLKTLTPLLQFGVGKLTETLGAQGVAAGAAPVAAGAPAPVVMPEVLPAGVIQFNCENCGNLITAREEWPAVECPRCHAVHTNGEPEASAPEENVSVLPSGPSRDRRLSTAIPGVTDEE